MPITLPTPLLPYRGRKMFRFRVVITQSGLDRELWNRQLDVPVIAPSAMAAVRLVQDEFAPKLFDPTEFECAGPKGGVTHRYMGYESIIGARMFAERSTGTQLTFL